MADEQNQETTETVINIDAETKVDDELAVLKERAKLMGISFSNNIKLETLREKINEKLLSEDKQDTGNELTGGPVDLRQELMDSAMRLVRLRIANLDPKKKDLPGEIFTVANEYIGTVRKFVPYGEATDDGYHVPFCIYQMLEEKRFLHIRTVRDRRTGAISTQTSWQKEFALEILPQLTEAELAQLAQAQIAAGSVDSSVSTDYMA